jgi:hypothetical protein
MAVPFYGTSRPKGIRRGGGIIRFTRSGLRSGGYYCLFLKEHTNGVRRGFVLHILHSRGRKIIVCSFRRSAYQQNLFSLLRKEY